MKLMTFYKSVVTTSISSFLPKYRYLGFCLTIISIFFVFSLKASAANLTSQTLNLSRVNESTPSIHTLTYVATSGVSAGESITVTYPVGFVIGASFDHTDVSFLQGDSNNCLTASYSPKTVGATPSGTTWGFSVSGQNLVFTSGTDTVTSDRCVRIVFQDNGVNRQIINPSVSSDQIFNISLESDVDDGQVAVIILDDPSTPDGDQIQINGSVITTIVLDLDTVLADCENNTEVSINSVNLGVLFPDFVMKSNASNTNFICVDLGTNASGGIKLYVQSSRNNTVGGLVSGGSAIESVTDNLNLISVSSGYGVRVASVGTPFMGSFSAVAPFNSGTSASVGLIPGALAPAGEIISANVASRTGTSSRIGIEFAAKTNSATQAGNYSDILTFTALVNL